MTSYIHQLQTSAGVVEYADAGAGIPALYFHGTGAGLDAALLLEQPLLRSDCRLIIPNRPGYYGTTLAQPGYLEPCLVHALEVLDQLGIPRVVVIGTSGGGMPAAHFAERYPSRSAGLILQCCQSHRWDHAKWLPVGLGATLFLFRHSIFAPLLRWETRRRARLSHRIPGVSLRQMSGMRFQEIASDGEVIRQIAELAALTLKCADHLDGVQNDWAILVGDNGLRKGMARCETLIIHDRADPLVPFAHAEWSQECIPQAELLDVHAGGHLIWFGQDFASLHKRRVKFMHETLG